jgi:hypothetical protein
MIWVINNKCISEMVTDIRMKQLENSMKPREFNLETLDIGLINYSANFNSIFKFFPCTPQLWLVDIGCSLWNSPSKRRRLLYLDFHICPHVEVARKEVWECRGRGDGSCSICSSLRLVSLQEVPHSHMKMRRNSILFEMEIPLKIFLYLDPQPLFQHV